MIITPLISIVIPIYKAEKYINKCIESILSQTFKNFEIILIDDGSPDNSGRICDQYAAKDKRISVYHQANSGVSSARQYGLNQAKGEYIIHVDPDDWIESSMLEELYKKAKEENADMVICDYYKDYSKTNRNEYIKQNPSQLRSDIVLKELFLHLHGSCCNKLVRRACFTKYNIKFPIELRFCEDLYVNAALLKNNIKVTYLNKAFYHYVQDINSNSLVNTYSLKVYEHDIKMKSLFDSLLIKENVFPVYEKKMVYLIIGRAFNSNLFSSKEFKSIFSKYANLLYNNTNIPVHHRYAYYLSCIGYYNLAYLLYKIYIHTK